MELRQLRHFVAVVDTGSISRAAEKVCLTQPALTRSMQSLEDVLQARLLDRRPRGIVPTEAGRVLYDLATQIINETQRAASDVASIATGEKGHLHVGIAALFSNALIDQIVVELVGRHPGLSIRIEEGYFEDLVSKLLVSELDVILSNFPPGLMPDGIRLEPLLTIRSQFVAGRTHHLARKRKVTIADLHECQWAIINLPHVTELLSGIFSNEGFPNVRHVIETNSLGVLINLVKTGKFVSLLPEHLFSGPNDTRSVKALHVTRTAPILRRAGLIVREGGYQSPSLAKFLTVARELCKRSSTQEYFGRLE